MLRHSFDHPVAWDGPKTRDQSQIMIPKKERNELRSSTRVM